MKQEQPPESKTSCHVARQSFSCRPKDRVRIVLDWQGQLRPIFWFSLARDGGVYAGPRAESEPGEVRHGRGIPGPDGTCEVKYTDGERVTDPGKPKLSFHPSGVVHLPASRLFRKPLASIVEPSLLCHVAFQHPRSFAAIEADRFADHDVLIALEADESRPLLAWLHFLPGSTGFIEPACLNWQIDLVFRCSGFQPLADFRLAFAIGPGPVGAWPPSTYLFVPEEHP